VKRARWVAGVALAGAIGCGIRVGRDLGQMQPQVVIYDDVCKVQDYFDAVAIGQEKEPAVVSSTDVVKGIDGAALGGRATFSFQTDAQLRLIRRVLNDNWEKLPDKLRSAHRIDLEVKWAEKAGVRRVVTTEDAQISYDGTTAYLPYHICLSELLFGAPLYRTRRDLLGLPPLAPPVDAHAADARPEGGAAVDAQAIH